MLNSSMLSLRLRRGFSWLRQNEILVILALVEATHMMGAGIVSPVLPLYARSFGVGVALVGLAISLFGVGRFLLNVPTGLLSDRLGRRVVIIGGSLIVIVTSVLAGLAQDIWQLVFFRLLAGMGSGMYSTGAMTLLADVSHRGNRARIMSVYEGSLFLGVTLGPAPGGIIADLYGFRAPFFFAALVTFVSLLWAVFRLPETRGRMVEEPSFADGPAAVAAQEASRSAVWRVLLRDVNFLLLGLVIGSLFFTRTGSRLGLIPIWAVEHIRMSATELGIIFSLSSLSNLLMLPFAGILADRWGRKLLIAPWVALESVGVALYALSDNRGMFYLASVFYAVGNGVAGPAPPAYAADLAPPGGKGMTIGLYRSFGDVGFVLGPVLLGWLADSSGFATALWSNAFFLFGAAALFWLAAKETLVRAGPLPKAGGSNPSEPR